MAYSEENRQVVLTMSSEDYQFLIFALGVSAAARERLHDSIDWINQVVSLLNRLNEGNPNYTPYQLTDTSNAPRG